MALLHFSLKVRKNWKSATEKQSVLENAFSKERKQHRQLQSEQQKLQDRVAALEKAEANFQAWEKRKPMIQRECRRFTVLHPY